MKRQQGRHRLRLLLAGVSLASALGLAWLVVDSPLLNVDRIEVVGASRTSALEVAAASGVRHGAPLLRVDRRGAARRIERLPWVAHAHVGFDLPRGLTVRISERRPAASVARPDGVFVLVDRDGRVLAQVGPRPDAIPDIAGVGAVPAVGGWLASALPALAVQGALPDDLRSRLAETSIAGDAVTAHLVGGPELRFGSIDGLAAKVAAVRAVMASLGTRTVAYVDVRVPSAPVVGS